MRTKIIISTISVNIGRIFVQLLRSLVNILPLFFLFVSSIDFRKRTDGPTASAGLQKKYLAKKKRFKSVLYSFLFTVIIHTWCVLTYSRNNLLALRIKKRFLTFICEKKIGLAHLALIRYFQELSLYGGPSPIMLVFTRLKFCGIRTKA